MAFDIRPLLQNQRAALLLSEVQRSVVGDQSKLGALAEAAQQVGVIGNSAQLAEAARRAQCPVVHCLASTDPARFGANTNARLFRSAAKRGSDASPHLTEYDTPCPEVWQEGDVLSKRDHGLSPMADSQLERRLRNADIDTVVIAGVSLNIAILNLTMDAVNSGFQVIVASDAVAGIPLDYAKPVMQNTLANISTLASSDEIVAAWH